MLQDLEMSSVKNWGLDRRASLRRHEDEVLANENAYAHRTEQERNKKILNNFEMGENSSDRQKAIWKVSLLKQDNFRPVSMWPQTLGPNLIIQHVCIKNETWL